MNEVNNTERVLLEGASTGYRAEQDRRMRMMEETIRQQAERIKELEAELERRRREE